MLLAYFYYIVSIYFQNIKAGVFIGVSNISPLSFWVPPQSRPQDKVFDASVHLGSDPGRYGGGIGREVRRERRSQGVKVSK